MTKVSDYVHPSYYSEEETDKYLKDKAEKKKFLERSYTQSLETTKRKSIKALINGKEYESASHAARDLGTSASVIIRHLKALDKTRMSEIEVDIAIKKKFTFKKIKE